MNQKLHYKIRVTGRVQGVGFRWNAAREARDRGLTGYVKNLSDGSVFLEAEGSEEQLNGFIKWCKKGPGFSFVESVIVDSSQHVNYVDFLIL